VIIPTHDRVDSLMRTVHAFDRQTVDPPEMEMIVVADGCSDSTERTFGSFAGRYRSRLLVQGGLGAAAARNAGAAVASGRVLLFMDDDIEPTPGLVAAHIRAHATGTERVVMGPYPPSLKGRSSFFRMHTRNWWQTTFAEVGRAGHRFHYRDLLSGNLSVRSELYRRLGGFDPVIRGAGGEDYEFGARVIEAGIDLVFAPDAEAVHHEHETMTLAGALRRATQEGRANVIIGRLHPIARYDLFAAFEDPQDQVLRRMRSLVFRRRWLGRMLAWLALSLLPVLERLKMRRRWRKVFGALHAYHYWRGVADEIGSEAALSAYMERAPVKPPAHDVDFVIDLAEEGMEAAERRLDAMRPACVRLRLGSEELGEIAPARLAEPLRGAHLRPVLVDKFTWPTVRALAVRASGLEAPRPLDARAP
jgi:GT2 family glycosyltransferase